MRPELSEEGDEAMSRATGDAALGLRIKAALALAETLGVYGRPPSVFAGYTDWANTVLSDLLSDAPRRRAVALLLLNDEVICRVIVRRSGWQAYDDIVAGVGWEPEASA
jgi:hypothetical protein